MKKFEKLELTNQHGKKVKLVDDVLAGKTVAVNFIFTNCATICPPMGATFGKLSAMIEEKKLAHISLVSISLDANTDTPQRLKTWSTKFDARDNWTLLTGNKIEVDEVIKALKVYSADITAHAPFILIADTQKDQWVRKNGFTSPDKLLKELEKQATATRESAKSGKSAGDSAATREYFSDVILTDHLGKKHRFYSDLMQGKTVVVHSFFTRCKGACPVLLEQTATLQKELEDELGTDLNILSITLDPTFDTPGVLAEYAKGLEPKPGWYFLSGPKKNVEWALYRIGHYSKIKEEHSNVFAIGNDKTSLWKKAFGLDPKLNLPQVVQEVMDDKG